MLTSRAACSVLAGILKIKSEDLTSPTPPQNLTEVVAQGRPSPSAMAGEGTGCVTDIDTALQEVLKITLIQEGLAQGIYEASKVLDQHSTQLCMPAFNYDEPLGM